MDRSCFCCCADTGDDGFRACCLSPSLSRFHLPALSNLLPALFFDNFRVPQNHNQVSPCSSCSITSGKDTCFGFFLTLLKPLVLLPRRSALAPSTKWRCQLRLKLGHARTFFSHLGKRL